MTIACGFTGRLLREDRDIVSGLGKMIKMGSSGRAFENDHICFKKKTIIVLIFGDWSGKHAKFKKLFA